MRIVFFGTPVAAVPSLEALISAGHEVARVVTRADRPAGRSRTPVPPPVKRCALDHGLEVLQPRKVRTAAFVQTIGELQSDLIVVVAYGRILSRALLDVPRLGPVNVHFSLLPELRGAAPVQWALARGAAVTGVTTMLMNERLDEGDVLLQARIPIEPGEHAPALEARLAELGAALLAETVDRLAAGTLEAEPQDHGSATFAPPLSTADGALDPGLEAGEIEGRVRGFDPWPGVWLQRAGKRLRIVDAQTDRAIASEEPPGTLLDLGGAIGMTCGGGTVLRLIRVQLEGRRVVDAADAVRGRQIRAGERLARLARG